MADRHQQTFQAPSHTARGLQGEGFKETGEDEEGTRNAFKRRREIRAKWGGGCEGDEDDGDGVPVVVSHRRPGAGRDIRPGFEEATGRSCKIA